MTRDEIFEAHRLLDLSDRLAEHNGKFDIGELPASIRNVVASSLAEIIERRLRQMNVAPL